MAATAHARECPVAPCTIYSVLKIIFLHCKEESNGGGGGAGGKGGFGGLSGLYFHKELDVAKGEGGGYCVCSTHTVFSGLEEEEEIDPGKV